jgi:ribosomal protein L7/L12
MSSVPEQYLFFLAGLAMGGLIGWVAGRRSMSAAAPVLAEAPAPVEAPPQAEEAGIKLVVNGNTVEVPAGAMAEIQSLIQAGQKAEAAKVLREATGLNSAAAKSVVESLQKVIG